MADRRLLVLIRLLETVHGLIDLCCETDYFGHPFSPPSTPVLPSEEQLKEHDYGKSEELEVIFIRQHASARF